MGSTGLVLCWLLSFWLLPKLMNQLPRDRGRAHAVQSTAAQGKPTGAGLIFVSLFIIVQLFVLPPSWQGLGILCFTFVEMM